MGTAVNSMKQKGHVKLDGDGSGSETIKTDAEMKAEYKSQMEDLRKSEAYETDADLHPIFKHAETLGRDVLSVAETVIDQFKRCIR